jgi:hypothetical protein
MPRYNWSITYLGEGVEAPNEDALKKTLLNQTSISGNVAGSLKNIRVEVDAQSGIISAAGSPIPDVRRH